MLELSRNEANLKPFRLKAEQDRLAFEMQRILKPSIRRLAARKNMTKDLQDEIDQHTFIAICRALRDWNPEIATFSTHVHWKVRAELQTLQHFEFPDRRRLAVPVKINFLELDRPYTGEDGSTCTMADYLVDESAEDSVEAAARHHIAMHTFERAFSHAIARQMQAYCINQTDQEKIAARRHSLMRNRWIYIRRTFCLETYEQIAQEYNVTRERARQIIIGVDDDMKGQLPKFCKKTNQVVPASRKPPEDIHPSWDYMLIDFYMATGEDTRLFNRQAPMPTRVDEYDFRPEVQIVEQTDAEMLAEFERIEDEAPSIAPEIVPAPIDNVVKLPNLRGALRQASLGAIAGAMLTTAVAANAQSRAIPPEIETARSASVTIEPTGKVQHVRRQPQQARGTSERSAPVVDITRIMVGQPSWGIRIANYQSAQEARKEGNGERKNWQWLRGLRAAYISPDAAGMHGIAYGPLTEGQANGMCHEAKRLSKPCQVVRFGVERQAAKNGRDVRA